VEANVSWKKLGEVKNRKLGKIFFQWQIALKRMAQNATILRITAPFFFFSPLSQITCTFTFEFVPPPLFAFIIQAACTKFGQLIRRKIINCCHQMSF